MQLLPLSRFHIKEANLHLTEYHFNNENYARDIQTPYKYD